MDASAFFQYPGIRPVQAEAAMCLLRNASDEQWRKLLAHTTSRRFAAGEWLIREGETDDALYFLGSGELEVLMPRGPGAPRRLAVVQSGSVVGEQTFLEPQPSSTTSPPPASARSPTAKCSA